MGYFEGWACSEDGWEGCLNQEERQTGKEGRPKYRKNFGIEKYLENVRKVLKN